LGGPLRPKVVDRRSTRFYSPAAIRKISSIALPGILNLTLFSAQRSNSQTMRHDHSRTLLTFLALALVISAIGFTACEAVEQNHAATSSASASNAPTGKIPVTTSSEEARKEFLAGRDLSEKLRITDSIAHFDKALSLDPNFALAELLRANVRLPRKSFSIISKKPWPWLGKHQTASAC